MEQSQSFKKWFHENRSNPDVGSIPTRKTKLRSCPKCHRLFNHYDFNVKEIIAAGGPVLSDNGETCVDCEGDKVYKPQVEFEDVATQTDTNKAILALLAKLSDKVTNLEEQAGINKRGRK